MRKVIKFSIFFLIAVLAPFVIANEALRWTWYRNYPLAKITRWDTQLIYCLKPNFSGHFPIGLVTGDAWKGKNAYWQLKINSQQIRSPYKVNPKTANSYRIVCLGDSITFGLEVDDQYTYPAQLQSILNNSSGRPLNAEVINAGVWGFSSRQGLVYLEQRLLKYEPDLVILEFGINDGQSSLMARYPDREIIRGDIASGWKKIYASPLSAFFLVIDVQPLVVFSKHLILMMRVGILMANLGQIDKAGIKTRGIGQENINSRRYHKLRVPPKDFRDNYLQFIALSKQEGFGLMFYIPYGVPEVFRKQILSLANQYRIPVLDFSDRYESITLKELTSHPEYNRLLGYYRNKVGDEFLKKHPRFLISTDNGVHLNAVGNRVVAEDMARIILSNYTVPAKP